MRSVQNHYPVILLMDGSGGTDQVAVKNWLEQSRFRICEALDIFGALETLSDFTTRERPDIVLLEVESPVTDFPMLRQLVQNVPGDIQHPIIAFSNTGKRIDDEGCFEGDLPQITAQLETIIPKNAGAIAH